MDTSKPADNNTSKKSWDKGDKSTDQPMEKREPNGDPNGKSQDQMDDHDDGDDSNDSNEPNDPNKKIDTPDI